MTSQLNIALIRKLLLSLMCLALLLLLMGVFTTRHWKTSSQVSQVVQELNGCTVAYIWYPQYIQCIIFNPFNLEAALKMSGTLTLLIFFFKMRILESIWRGICEP